MIPNIGLRGNRWLKEALVPAIVVLVAIGAFGLGRLSVLQAQEDKLIIHQPGETVQ
ncbi:MAG: hypothetical protein Q7R71_01175 [bacterium]|nr:hypothetical protein [bacterium]